MGSTRSVHNLVNRHEKRGILAGMEATNYKGLDADVQAKEGEGKHGRWRA